MQCRIGGPVGLALTLCDDPGNGDLQHSSTSMYRSMNECEDRIIVQGSHVTRSSLFLSLSLSLSLYERENIIGSVISTARGGNDT